jgi:hypothetical protein
MAESTEPQNQAPAPGKPPDPEELLPAEEKEWERLDKQGGAAGANAGMERTMASGGRVVMDSEAQLSLVAEESGTAEAAGRSAQATRKRRGKGIQTGPKRKMSPRARAWGETTGTDDGTYNLLS